MKASSSDDIVLGIVWRFENLEVEKFAPSWKRHEHERDGGVDHPLVGAKGLDESVKDIASLARVEEVKEEGIRNCEEDIDDMSWEDWKLHQFIFI